MGKKKKKSFSINSNENEQSVIYPKEIEKSSSQVMC